VHNEPHSEIRGETRAERPMLGAEHAAEQMISRILGPSPRVPRAMTSMQG
jgi:hypothetical protein